MTKERSCESRVQEHLEGRLEDLRTLWDLYHKDVEAYDENFGNMCEYGLCFDYVGPDTFDDQKEGYFRYQLSWGGPGDEFRIYAQKVKDYQFSVYRIEYWFLDWFDGASRTLYDTDYALLEEIFGCFFVDSGTANHQLEQAME